MNYDGAIFTDSDEAGLGVVIRNDSGLVIAVLSKKIHIPCSVELVELQAVRKAVHFAAELGFHQVCLEGDSKIVFKALSLATPHPSLHDHFVKDIQSILNSFRAHSFSHVIRQGNSVAHALTRSRRVRLYFLLIVWMEFATLDFSSLVIAYFPT